MSLKGLSELFKALSDPTRLKILKLLQGGELCVCDIMSALDMVQPKVSFHLRVLRSAGLIKDRKVGKWIHYNITDMDIFKRFMVLSAVEQIDDKEMEGCTERLNKFMKNKPQILANKSCICGGK